MSLFADLSSYGVQGQTSGRWRLIIADTLLASYFLITTLTIAINGAYTTKSEAWTLLRR
jgi:hypothetical protein